MPTDIQNLDTLAKAEHPQCAEVDDVKAKIDSTVIYCRILITGSKHYLRQSDLGHDCSRQSQEVHRS